MAKLRYFLRCASRALLINLLGQMITLHGRRVILITSLYAEMRQQEAYDKEVLKKLNHALGLAEDTSGMLLPAHFHKWFWDQEQLKQALEGCGVDGACLSPEDAGDATKIAEILADITPRWLRYGRRRDMVEDFSRLLHYQTVMGEVA